MKLGSLFAGIGGFDLAASWLGWKTAWFSEIEPHASLVLKRHWPNVPNHGDITTIDGSAVEPVDILCGGFPCQDISLIGKRAGIEGERSGLWSHYARLIGELRPRYIVAENVAALRSAGLDAVLKDLGALGYDAEWHCIPASAVGAPHRRDRCWIVAYPAGFLESESRHEAEAKRDQGNARLESGRRGMGLAQSVATSPLADRIRTRLEGYARHEDADGRRAEEAGSVGEGSLPLGGFPGSEQWAFEPNVGRVAYGLPASVVRARLTCLGNAIVPQLAFAIFSAIADIEAARINNQESQ